jgi:hypothetical protein
VDEQIQEILSIRGGFATTCPECDAQLWEGDDPLDWFDQQTNHLLSAHGWRLLHVGQETTRDLDGTPWHQTVAVLGRPGE